MEQRKELSRPRLERVSVAITYQDDVMSRKGFEELPLDFLSMCICEQYNDIEDMEKVTEMYKNGNFVPFGVLFTGNILMMFMRVYVKEALHVFGVGRFVPTTSPEAHYVLNSMTNVPEIPDDVDADEAQHIISRLTTGEAAEDRAKAGDRIKEVIQSQDDMPVPIAMCYSDFASRVTPSDISRVFNEGHSMKWDDITPINLDVMQRSLSQLFNHVVTELKRPIRVRAYGDHKWLDPESDLAKSVEKYGGVNTYLVEEV